MTGSARSDNRSIIATLVSVSIQRGKLWRPSRGPTSTTVIFFGRLSAIGSASQTFKAGKIADRRALGHQGIDRRVRIDVAERHAANNDFVFRNVQQRPNDRMKIG